MGAVNDGLETDDWLMKVSSHHLHLQGCPQRPGERILSLALSPQADWLLAGTCGTTGVYEWTFSDLEATTKGLVHEAREVCQPIYDDFFQLGPVAKGEGAHGCVYPGDLVRCAVPKKVNWGLWGLCTGVTGGHGGFVLE